MWLAGRESGVGRVVAGLGVRTRRVGERKARYGRTVDPDLTWSIPHHNIVCMAENNAGGEEIVIARADKPVEWLAPAG